MRPNRIAQHAAAVVLALHAAGCEPPRPPSTETGVAWELAEHRARTIAGVDYEIDLTVPESSAQAVRGRTRITLHWDDPDRHPLVVDFLDPAGRVDSVRVNGSSVAWEAVNDHIVIPAEALQVGRNRVEIAYVAGDEALNRSDDFLYALFVPDRAHFSLPVFDQPNLKATVTWRLTIPASWRAVANAPEIERSTLNETRTVRFLQTRPIPTYLFAFAAGRFQEDYELVGDRVLRMFHRETDAEKVARNRDAIFELHGRALDFLEEYTGIEYPFQKFDFVLVPSFQYGGMEHPGAVLYRQDALMLDETATQGLLLRRASLIAHETAHMWFGDLVTMNWFDDVWTKEVFANFMAAKIVQPSFPELDHELRFLMAHHPSAYGVDRTAGANAIRQPLENLREAGTLYGAIIYQKAPIVMRQLEARVGEETFRDGLREYLGTFAYGNATWPDLIEILDRRSPEDLAAWSRVWVEEAGRPRIRIVREGPDLVVVQEDPAGRGRVWPQTLTLHLEYDGGARSESVELGGEPVRLPGAAQALRFALPNGSGLEYGGFVLDEASLEHLIGHVAELEPALVRGAAWVTLWEQVLDGRLPPRRFLDASVRALPKESVELVLSRVLGYLSESYWRLLSAEERRAVAPAVEAAVWAGVTGPLPRTGRAAFLSTYREVATTEEGVDRMRALWSGALEPRGLPLGEADRTELASELALRGVADAETILTRQESAIENPDRRARFAFIRPSLSAEPAAREAFFASLADPANREREPWVLEGLRNLHHPLRAEHGLGLVRPALDMLEEIQRTGDIFFPGRWLDATLDGHSEPEAAAAVRAYLAESPELPHRLRAKVLQSADMVERAARIVHGGQGGGA